MQYDAGAIFRSPHFEHGGGFPVRHPRAMPNTSLAEVATSLGDYMAGLHPAHILPHDGNIMVATKDTEASAAMKQLNQDTDTCPIISLQMCDRNQDGEVVLIVVASTYLGTVAVFEVPRIGVGQRARLPKGLALLCTQVIVIGWEIHHTLKTLKIKEVKAAVEASSLDELCITHARFPYSLPRDLPYDNYLLNQLIYGHYFGALSKAQYQARAQHLQPVIPWSPGRDPRILFDWDIPFNSEQLAYLHNKGMAPFITLAFYTMLNMAGGQIKPKKGGSLHRLLHTGLALGLVRLDIDLSDESESSNNESKKYPRGRNLATGSNAIPLNNNCDRSFSIPDKMATNTASQRQGHGGALPKRPPGRALTLQELETGLRASAARYLGDELVDKLVSALKTEDANGQNNRVRAGVTEVAEKYLGSDLVRELEAALARAKGAGAIQSTDAKDNQGNNPTETAARRLAGMSVGDYPKRDTAAQSTGTAATPSREPSSPTSWADQAEAAENASEATEGNIPGGDPEQEVAGEDSGSGAAALGVPYRNIKTTPPRVLADGQKSKDKVKRKIKTTGREMPYRFREFVPWEVACARCGSEHHINCNRRVRPCTYPLCKGNPRTHALTSCPHLHMLCDLCRCRGHDRDQCVERDQDDLAEIFKEFAPEGRYTRRGVRAKNPITDWGFHGPESMPEELSEIHLLEKVVMVDWGADNFDEYAGHDVNGKYWQLEREILK